MCILCQTSRCLSSSTPNTGHGRAPGTLLHLRATSCQESVLADAFSGSALQGVHGAAASAAARGWHSGLCRHRSGSCMTQLQGKHAHSEGSDGCVAGCALQLYLSVSIGTVWCECVGWSLQRAVSLRSWTNKSGAKQSCLMSREAQPTRRRSSMSAPQRQRWAYAETASSMPPGALNTCYCTDLRCCIVHFRHLLVQMKCFPYLHNKQTQRLYCQQIFCRPLHKYHIV